MHGPPSRKLLKISVPGEGTGKKRSPSLKKA